jgi:hypothetical protein
MTCVRASLVALGAALLLASPALHAAPAREALVIGNGTYSALAPLPACLLSAHAVAAALRALDFHVVEREDVSSGGADAAIGEFAAQVAATPGAATPSSIVAATPLHSTTGRSWRRSRPGSHVRPMCSPRAFWRSR